MSNINDVIENAKKSEAAAKTAKREIDKSLKKTMLALAIEAGYPKGLKIEGSNASRIHVYVTDLDNEVNLVEAASASGTLISFNAKSVFSDKKVVLSAFLGKGVEGEGLIDIYGEGFVPSVSHKYVEDLMGYGKSLEVSPSKAPIAMNELVAWVRNRNSAKGK